MSCSWGKPNGSGRRLQHLFQHGDGERQPFAVRDLDIVSIDSRVDHFSRTSEDGILEKLSHVGIKKIQHTGIKTIQHVGIKAIEPIESSLERNCLGTFNVQLPQRDLSESEDGKHEGDTDPVNVRLLPCLTGMTLNSSLSPLDAGAMVFLQDPQQHTLRLDVSMDQRSLASLRAQFSLKHGKDSRIRLNRNDAPKGEP